MNRRAGFTIIELMVVIMILGILATLTYPAVRQSVARARAADLESRWRNTVLAVRATSAAGSNRSTDSVTSTAFGHVPSALTGMLPASYFTPGSGVVMAYQPRDSRNPPRVFFRTADSSGVRGHNKQGMESLLYFHRALDGMGMKHQWIGGFMLSIDVDPANPPPPPASH